VTPALETIVDRVAEDPDLTPGEKETSITFAKDRDAAAVFTSEAGLCRRLLSHPHATIGAVTVADGSARPEVSLKDVDKTEGKIVAVRATLPVGTLSVKGDPRSSGGHADVITHRVLSDGALKAPTGEL